MNCSHASTTGSSSFRLVALVVATVSTVSCSALTRVDLERDAASILRTSTEVVVRSAGRSRGESGGKEDRRAALVSALQRFLPSHKVRLASSTSALRIDVTETDLRQCFHCPQRFDRWYWDAYVFDDRDTLLLSLSGNLPKGLASPEAQIAKAVAATIKRTKRAA